MKGFWMRVQLPPSPPARNCNKYGDVPASTGLDKDFGSRKGDGPNPSKNIIRKR